MRKDRGCEGRLKEGRDGEGGQADWISPSSLPSMMEDGIEYWACPNRPLLDSPRFYDACLSAYKHYKKGFLSYDGGMESQPNKLMQAFQIIEVAVSECEVELEKREKVAARRKSRTGSVMGTR